METVRNVSNTTANGHVTEWQAVIKRNCYSRARSTGKVLQGESSASNLRRRYTITRYGKHKQLL